MARAAAAVFLTGLAVKLMDDFLDLRTDLQAGIPSAGERLGEATLPYALLLLALGALMDVRVAVPLFTASYAVGMAFDLSRVLPSGLYGWQEALLAVGAGAAFAGPAQQLWALAVVAFVQCMDDIADVNKDAWSGNSNLVRRLGSGEVHMAAFAALSAAAALQPVHTVFVCVAVAAVEAVVWHFATYRPRGGGYAPRGWTG